MKRIIFLFFLFITLNLFAQNYLLDFDGVNDCLTVPGNDSINTAGPYENRTIELWFKADTLPNDSLQTLYEEGGKIRGFHIYLHSDTLYVGAWNETETSWDGTWYHHSIFVNKWYHVALVLSNGTDTLENDKLFAYINGYEFSTGNKQGTKVYKHGGDINIAKHGFTKIHTGDVIYEGGFFDGQLNEIRVWNTARTQQQIQDNMYQEISTSSDRLVAYWNLDDGSGTTATDVTVNSNDATLTDMDPSTDWISGDLPPEPDTPEMMFSEISDNDLGGEATGFIEIYNPWAGSKDLSGYKIIVGTNPTGTNFIADTPEVSYTIPSGTTIGARDVIVVGNGANLSDFNSAWSTSLTSSDYVSGSSSLVIASGKAYALDNGSKGVVDTSPEINTYERRHVEENELWGDPEDTSNASPGDQDTEQDLPLPVTLSQFTALFANNLPLLTWVTMSEMNNSHWNVYRSLSNNIAQAIRINGQSIAGHGTTTETSYYAYQDKTNGLEKGKEYYYWIESVTYSGDTEFFGPASVFIPEQNEPDAPEIAETYGLLQNFPNPFNPYTNIKLNLKNKETVEVSIYNVKGQKIKTLFTGNLKGEKIFTWNGLDNKGNKVPSGIYFCSMKTKTKTENIKMILLK